MARLGSAQVLRREQSHGVREFEITLQFVRVLRRAGRFDGYFYSKNSGWFGTSAFVIVCSETETGRPTSTVDSIVLFTLKSNFRLAWSGESFAHAL
jgi:hypothetical protein